MASFDPRLILDAAADAVVAADVDGRIIYVNGAAERLLGWQAAMLIGRPSSTILPERLLDQQQGSFEDRLNRNAPLFGGQTFRLPLLRRDGVETTVSATLTVAGSGPERILIATIRDSRDEVSIERQLEVTRRLRAVNTAATRLALLTDTDSVLHFALVALQRDLSATLAQVWLLETDTPTIQARASRGFTPPALRQTVALTAERHAIARCVRSRRPEWLSRESLRALGDPLWLEQERIAAGAILPLISGDEVYGALTYFSRQEVPDELLETLANFAALTTASLHRIDRLRAEQDARAAAETAERHMRFLVEAGAALGSSLDSSETLQQLVQLAVPALGTESAIDVLDAARDRTRRIASAPPATGGEPAQLALDHLPEPARIITSSMSQLLSKSDLAEQASRLADSRIGSCLRVPLRFRGKSFAALTVVRPEGEESYTTADLRVAEDLAERAALALEKAWLFEEQVSAINRIQQLATEQRLVLSQIADGVVITDESGLITFANAAAHQIHGEVKLGRTIQEHARAHELRTPSGEPVPEHELILADALNARTSTYNVERRLCRDDGAEVTVLVSAAPLLNDQGLPRGAVMTLRDVTEIRELARQKDDFVIGASHDLKSPLTGIKGWAQLLLQRADKSEHLAHERAGLNAILGQAEAMQTLLERMLEAIRLQSTSLQASRLEVIDLCELAEQVVTMHLAATTMHDLRLNGAAAGDIIGKWDRGQIGQILDNLVGNAIKYSPKGGQVDVVLARDAEHAYVEVRDSGIGIPEEARPRVFNQFYRAPNTALDPAGARPDGLGLGLFSAQQLARRHGGRIDVQSRDGAGSVFRVTLPLSPVRAANEHESQPPKDEHASAE